ncbi:MAG: YdcF family protein [Gaiellaceae bacterium]
MTATAVVVLGNESRGPGGVYRISTACVRLVRETERLAALEGVRAVVFTGRTRGTGPSEAEQMRDEWRGPADVEVVVEPTAARTAENASRTLPLLAERGIKRALVVCTAFHRHRTRYFFSRLYAAAGIETQLHAVPVARTARALAWELGALPACRRQLRAARTELAGKGLA